jgi:hypothetical protein
VIILSVCLLLQCGEPFSRNYIMYPPFFVTQNVVIDVQKKTFFWTVWPTTFITH